MSSRCQRAPKWFTMVGEHQTPLLAPMLSSEVTATEDVQTKRCQGAVRQRRIRPRLRVGRLKTSGSV